MFVLNLLPIMHRNVESFKPCQKAMDASLKRRLAFTMREHVYLMAMILHPFYLSVYDALQENSQGNYFNT